MKKSLRAGAMLATFAGFAAASFAVGPKGLWMLTDGDNMTDALIQGASVNTYAQGADTTLQYAIQYDPVNDLFETIGRDQDQRGGVYTTNHTQIGTFGNFTDFDGQHLDGTLDTKRNRSYASNFNLGSVIQYGDGFFNHTATIFWDTEDFSIWSITYNQSRDSLFVGGNNWITELDMSGNVVGGFATQDGRVRSLAFDGTDNSMWFLSDSGVDAVQIDASGNELSRMTVNLGGNYWGGEIKAGVVPEPATMSALALGALAMLRKRRK